LFSHPGYTLTTSLLALVFAALIWTAGRQKWPRAVVILIIAGVGGLLATTAGRWAYHLVARLESGAGHVTGALFGVVFPGVIAIVLAAVVGFHLHHNQVGRGTLAAAVGLPLTAGFVPGVLGTILVGFVAFLTQALGQLGYLMFSSIHI
jgi:hypothetical protein